MTAADVIFIHSKLDEMGLPLAAFRVYAHLSRRANENGKSWPGVDSMAALCGCTKPTVINAIRLLEARNMIVVDRKTGGTSCYSLTHPDQWQPLPDFNRSKISTGKKEVTHQSKRGNATGKKEVTKGNPIEGNPIKVIQSSFLPQPEGDTTPSAHTHFIRLWSEEYQKFYGAKYKFSGGKDAQAVKSLLSTEREPEELVHDAVRAWTHTRKHKGGQPAFNSKQAASIAGFSSRYNDIIAELPKNGFQHNKENEPVW